MQKMYFGTTGLICRPLQVSELTKFNEIVTTDPYIQQFFRIDNPIAFWESLNDYDCIPVGVFLKSSKSSSDTAHKLIGYINGYVYSRDELLVEFFLTQGYCRNDYLEQLLSGYLNACKKLGLYAFRFEVEEGDDEYAAFLSDFGASRCAEDDFTDTTDGNRVFHVYKIIY